MAIKCNDPDRLIKHIENSYPRATKTIPSQIQTHFKFTDEFVVNIFTNKTVNFQGKPSPEIQAEIERQIEIFNRP
jgi:hypothetical protein